MRAISREIGCRDDADRAGLTTPSAIAETSLLIWLIAKGLHLAPRPSSRITIEAPSRNELTAPSVT